MIKGIAFANGSDKIVALWIEESVLTISLTSWFMA
jgi:hypothetical protein